MSAFVRVSCVCVASSNGGQSVADHLARSEGRWQGSRSSSLAGVAGRACRVHGKEENRNGTRIAKYVVDCYTKLLRVCDASNT